MLEEALYILTFQILSLEFFSCLHIRNLYYALSYTEFDLKPTILNENTRNLKYHVWHFSSIYNFIKSIKVIETFMLFWYKFLVLKTFTKFITIYSINEIHTFYPKRFISSKSNFKQMWENISNREHKFIKKF